MSHFGIRLLIAAVLAATLTGCGK
ncbi:MAG: hypothetical protein JWQ46_2272, partial [Phenylobacterium sp.]|nr:hypothetical protein [Phenylobacterium sp.]